VQEVTEPVLLKAAEHNVTLQLDKLRKDGKAQCTTGKKHEFLELINICCWFVGDSSESKWFLVPNAGI